MSDELIAKIWVKFNSFGKQLADKKENVEAILSSYKNNIAPLIKKEDESWQYKAGSFWSDTESATNSYFSRSEKDIIIPESRGSAVKNATHFMLTLGNMLEMEKTGLGLQIINYVANLYYTS